MDRPDADDAQHAADQAGAADKSAALGQAGAADKSAALGQAGAADKPGEAYQRGEADRLMAAWPAVADRLGDDGAGAAGRANPAERPNRNVARGEATRVQLITIATRMFAERGYEDTSIEAVLREAGVSRGSLYHHFPSKEALFEAVAEEVETSVGAQTVRAATGSEGPEQALRAGFVAWIRLAGDPVVRRILLIDGPSVLGWERWRAMEENHALGLVRAALQVIAEQGKLRPELVGSLAHVLLASVNELALLVARSDDKETAMRAGADTIDELLRRLFSLSVADNIRKLLIIGHLADNANRSYWPLGGYSSLRRHIGERWPTMSAYRSASFPPSPVRPLAAAREEASLLSTEAEAALDPVAHIDGTASGGSPGPF